MIEWSNDKMVEVTLAKEDDFLKVKETLTRIGIASHKTKTLWQSCHILHKKGKYYIVHFKEMFALDGKPANLTVEDMERRNTIIRLLADWELCTVVNPAMLDEYPNKSNVKVIRFGEKADWNLETKYNIGVK